MVVGNISIIDVTAYMLGPLHVLTSFNPLLK